ncbi:hypothetical protein [Ralstonia sp. A12]|uniref:hypothetical protein n=1 Tax=Ralstonia sp. A12 TaxID=1217052 RepID=UPI0012ED9B7C|nr:hypothetical protein [Ralstonia sp. A12]
MTTLTLPRLVVLDTSHIVGLAADSISPNREQRRAAEEFIHSLVEHAWLPLLCWHHVEELLQHQNDKLVEARLRYLRSWPLMAWIQAQDSRAGPGSVVDVLQAEVVAAHRHAGTDALEVRELARDSLLAMGPGTEAIPEVFRDWRLLRSTLVAQQQKAREITAISRWRAMDVDGTRVADWMDKPLRHSDEAARMLQLLRGNLTKEIATRGDRRISDPATVADTFISEIVRGGQAINRRNSPSPAIQTLVNAGMDLEDIDPSITLAEATNLLTFHKRLAIVAKTSGLPLQELKRTVTQNRLPVTVIQECMRLYAHDQPERKGSELNDVHLLCLAPYADVTYVDKRTLESVRRAKGKNAVFAELVEHVGKAGSYSEILATLTTL